MLACQGLLPGLAAIPIPRAELAAGFGQQGSLMRRWFPPIKFVGDICISTAISTAVLIGEWRYTSAHSDFFAWLIIVPAMVIVFPGLDWGHSGLGRADSRSGYVGFPRLRRNSAVSPNLAMCQQEKSR